GGNSHPAVPVIGSARPGGCLHGNDGPGAALRMASTLERRPVL
ncbi:MAG: hypothetical protein AVDCRST_MAG56-3941, partial [uncultured Cytophagales bacterium]